MVTRVTSAAGVVEMKDGEKALLALAAVGGYLYWAKTDKTKQPMMTHRDGDPYGNGRDGDYSNSPYTRGPDGKMISSLSIPNPVYGKKGGIHNALKSVAPSVPRARVLTPTPERKKMFGRLSKTDQSLLTKNGGRMTDRQKVQLLEKYGWYTEGMHPDLTTFDADGNKVQKKIFTSPTSPPP